MLYWFFFRPSWLKPLLTFSLLSRTGWGLKSLILSVAMASQNAQAALELQWGDSIPFSYERLIQKAKQMALSPPIKESPAHSAIVSQIDYSAWQSLRYRPEAALFRDQNGHFPVTFFHVGSSLPQGIQIFRLEGDQAFELFYNPSYFSASKNSVVRELPANTGFGGFRVQQPHGPDPTTRDWLMFLGGSYFRAVGEDGVYGASARPLLIYDQHQEEHDIPTFREFFLEDAKSNSAPVTTYALLEGEAVTATFRFISSLSKGVTQEVDADLFFRQTVKGLGLVPLKTMYWFSETDKARLEDWRPEVHDSDGLAILTGSGEKIWRPLLNPPTTSTSMVDEPTLKGFGLIQRDRLSDHYLDEEHHFEKRPNVWVELVDGWNAGQLELIEHSTANEINDNVTVYWKPKFTIQPGAHLHLRYRLHWTNDEPFPGNLARCVSTRLGQITDERDSTVKNYQISVEFDGPKPSDKAQPRFRVEKGRVIQSIIENVPGTERWRVLFEVKPESQEPVDLTLQVRLHSNAVSEIWTYRLYPSQKH